MEAENIERFVEDQAFSFFYDLAPPHLFPLLYLQQVVFISLPYVASRAY
jgi:hypothetical protein